MIIDIHNHTNRCNHATGDMGQYIKKAISSGIDIYGFSCHAPIKQNIDPHNRMPLSDIDEYIKDIKKLKQKYKNSIKILTGFEVDYLTGDYIYDEILNTKVDYLIGSVHFIPLSSEKYSLFNPKFWGFDNPDFIGQYEDKDIDTIWQNYFDAVELMAKSKLFDIVGHLDLIKIFGFMPTKDPKSLAQKAIKQIKLSGMSVEINSAGLRKPIGEQYPSTELLQLCFDMDIPITFGSDAHNVEHINSGYDICLKLAKDVGYTKAVYYENRQKISIKI
ncbi:MAG: histidinol-phosphatase [Epsilonproteobacteria bacterium]|nr:MAG: histidinol-phosphatase [Campylobacterota bacterium]